MAYTHPDEIVTNPARPGGFDVVTLGEVMALILAEPGMPLTMAGTFSMGVAGAEATTVAGLARLSRRVAYIGRLGADPLGERVLRWLRSEGVATHAVRVDPDAPTGLIVRDAVADRPIQVVYHRAGSAGSRLSTTDLPLKDIAGARVLHVSALTAMLSPSCAEAVRLAVSTAREAGVTVCFDPNVRRRLGTASDWRAMVDELGAEADLVLVGRDEADWLGITDPHAWFRDHGAATVVVKDGSRGASETGVDGAASAPARPTTVVDVVGAGDAFAAGWLDAWLSGHPPTERLRRGAALASLVVGVAGDTSGLPSRGVFDNVLSGGEDVLR